MVDKQAIRGMLGQDALIKRGVSSLGGWTEMSTLFLSKMRHGEAQILMTIIQLEDFEDTFGSGLLSLVTGHDVDADKRQRNREIVSSGDYRPTREEMQTLLERTPGKRKPGDGIRPPALRLSLILP